MTTVGLLHPGAMGATVGGTCAAPVMWCSSRRSAATVDRAARYGLDDVGTLDELVARSDTIVSVCPPDEAPKVADAVAALGFTGVYVDANAISPATARAIGERFDRFVDGGIIGPPAEHAGTTRMYLCGAEAPAIADLWADSVLDVRVIAASPGAASALKMAYATWTKVTSALLLDVRALARVEGVETALLEEWELSQPGTAERSERTAAAVGPKAWRFIGEMEQIAASFDAAGLPDGFAVAAAEVYRRLTDLRDRDATLDAVLDRL